MVVVSWSHFSGGRMVVEVEGGGGNGSDGSNIRGGGSGEMVVVVVELVAVVESYLCALTDLVRIK